MNSIKRLSSVAVDLASAFGVLGESAKSAGKSVLDFMSRIEPSSSFAQLYGNCPRPINGTLRNRSGVAAAKRAKRKRRNIAKNPKSANGRGAWLR
jgi:hypothetical protein